MLAVLFTISYLAFSVSAICGGGAGLILVPILNIFLPVSQVPAAISIGSFSSSFSRIAFFYKNIRWHIVKWFVPAAIPAVWFGAYLLKFVAPAYLSMVMGFFLIANFPLLFKKNDGIDEIKKGSNLILIFIGCLAGFLSGITGVVGLLFNRFYFRYGLTKEQIVATRAANEIILHLIKIILYFTFGLLSPKVFLIGVVISVSALLSSWSMRWILPHLSPFLFKKIGYFAMVLSGVMLLIKSGNGLIEENEGKISVNFISKGIKTKLEWQNKSYSIDLNYDRGLEFEKIISLQKLNDRQRAIVFSQQGQADKVIIEEVYRINKVKTFEAYYFKGGSLIHKIYFK